MPGDNGAPVVIRIHSDFQSLSTAPQNKVTDNRSVTPAKAGVRNALKGLLSDFKVRALDQTGRRPAAPLSGLWLPPE
jgi:hypothetical protein